jgi:hypothetical protein
MTEAPPSVAAPRGPGWRAALVVLACYVGCVAVATYPMAATFGSALPGHPNDPLQHLWVMRWYRTCLLEGRSPRLCPELHHPVGAPLGNFSPLHLQAMLYVPLSLAVGDDALCFDLIWLVGLVTTGLGTAWLVWRALRDRPCAAIGGMMAMLAAPVLLHAQEHVELIYVGAVPAFLAAWPEFVDRPSRGRLAAAAGLYVLVALSAAYFAVFVAAPAALYVAWEAARAARRGEWAWLRPRAAWLAAFAAAVVPALALAFSNQIWALARGYAIEQPASVFEHYGAPPWTYLVPTSKHLLGRALPLDAYRAAGIREEWERASYLGVTTLGLLAFAIARRVRFPRAGYWWAALALLVLLGWGATARIGPWSVPLPAGWLKRHAPPFRMIRVPARFNLLVAVVAPLPASAALRDMLARRAGRAWRAIALGGAALVALLDLSMVPFPTAAIPEPPPCYAWLRRRDPGAAFLEIPQHHSGAPEPHALLGYWQSRHRGRTNAGYCGSANVVADNLVAWTSPFLATELSNPAYLADPDDFLNHGLHGPSPSCADVVYSIGPNRVGFRDYVWLYLTVHRFDEVILHRDRVPAAAAPMVGRLRAQLRGAEVFEDRAAVVFERARLAPPGRPVVLPTRGWRPTLRDRLIRVAGREAHLALYNPDPGRPLALALEARALQRARTVRLVAPGRELARWTIAPGPFRTVLSPPFRLPAGVQGLALVSDAEERPSGPEEAALGWDFAPYSLEVSGVFLARVPDATATAVAGRAGSRR